MQAADPEPATPGYHWPGPDHRDRCRLRGPGHGAGTGVGPGGQRRARAAALHGIRQVTTSGADGRGNSGGACWRGPSTTGPRAAACAGAVRAAVPVRPAGPGLCAARISADGLPATALRAPALGAPDCLSTGARGHAGVSAPARRLVGADALRLSRGAAGAAA